MKDTGFAATVRELMVSAPEMELGPGAKVLVVSDLHVGNGSVSDDFTVNEALFLDALDSLYLKEGWTVVLNGDIEELQKFKYREIVSAHAGLYDRLSRLSAEERLYKILGNHDLGLLARENGPFPLHHALLLRRGDDGIVCFHGHQASKFFSRHAYVSGFIVRYIAQPLKIKNVDRPIKSQIKNERRIYKAAKALGVACVTGHTHRPLFESLDKKDWLKFSLERLLALHPESSGEERERLERDILLHVRELKRLSKRRKRRGFPIRSFYETDGIPVPCLFNSGCATARGGFTAIEIDGEDIALVEWSRPDMAREWVEREALSRFAIPGLDAIRYTLRREPLDVVFSKIRLLGAEEGGIRQDALLPPRGHTNS
jgi:UDP-2,3-diacylglucosamine pyrophosphatase LpxH